MLSRIFAFRTVCPEARLNNISRCASKERLYKRLHDKWFLPPRSCHIIEYVSESIGCRSFEESFVKRLVGSEIARVCADRALSISTPFFEALDQPVRSRSKPGQCSRLERPAQFAHFMTSGRTGEHEAAGCGTISDEPSRRSCASASPPGFRTPKFGQLSFGEGMAPAAGPLHDGLAKPRREPSRSAILALYGGACSLP